MVIRMEPGTGSPIRNGGKKNSNGGSSSGSGGGPSGSKGSSGGGHRGSGGHHSKNGHGKGKKGHGKKPWKLGKMPGVPWGQATNIVQHQLAAEIAKLYDEARASKRDMEHANDQIHNEYDQTKGDLKYLFTEARDNLNGRLDDVNGNFDRSRQQMNQVYRNFSHDNRLAVNDRRKAAEAELRRLGMGGDIPLTQFNADASYANNMAQVNQANALANMTAMKMGSKANANALRNMITGSRVSELGKAANLQTEALLNNRHAYTQQANDIMDEVRNTRAGAWSRINELALQLQAQKFDQTLAWKQAQYNMRPRGRGSAVGGVGGPSGSSSGESGLAAALAEARRKAEYQTRMSGPPGANLGQQFAGLFG